MINGVMVPQRRGGATQGKAPMSQFEALRSWRYAKGQPTAAQAARQFAQRWYRGQGGGATPSRASRAKRPASMAGVCTVATLLLVVPLFTLEADARGGFGGHGGGFRGAGGGFGGRRGGVLRGARRRLGGCSLLRRGALWRGGRWGSLLRRGAFRRRGSWPSLLRRGALRRVAYRRPRHRRPQFGRAFIGVAARRDRAVRGRGPPLFHRLRAHARGARHTPTPRGGARGGRH